MLLRHHQCTETAEPQFRRGCINGMRFLSNCSVVAMHICIVYFYVLRNFEELKPTIESWITPVAANHIVTVDTFFVIRLTPVYMAVLGIYTFILPYMGSGPLWPRYCTHPACEKNGWYNLFYINNFVIAEKQCMLWCWYLAVEIQFYIISPLFMVLLQRSSRFGYSLIGVVTFASCLANFVITNQKNLLDGPVRFFQHLKEPLYQDRFFRYFNLVYQKPYTRIPPYLIGIGLGYYFYTRRENKDRKNSLMFLCFGWFVTALMMGFCYLGLYNRDESAIESAVYNGLKHLFFPCGLAWIIFLCITGQGGLINRFLSCRAFLPLARLSYCAYLIHFLFLLRYFRSLTEMQDHSELLFLSIYTRTLLYTYATSFFASLLFEIPVLNLLDVYKKKRRPRT
ncbi:nose resistant to fluoxetine protein 6 [Caerostris darwini]|uniref:Nose resistant to fluoxetine protein 6 n=1 Tax=Caerostris darwini TaxID=1538125 RepID=A0AAV4N0F6_9ARAC|nr:nose resistant to fluoxetine protein 6 [Caerostris darwini]